MHPQFNHINISYSKNQYYQMQKHQYPIHLQSKYINHKAKNIISKYSKRHSIDQINMLKLNKQSVSSIKIVHKQQKIGPSGAYHLISKSSLSIYPNTQKKHFSNYKNSRISSVSCKKHVMDSCIIKKQEQIQKSRSLKHKLTLNKRIMYDLTSSIENDKVRQLRPMITLNNEKNKYVLGDITQHNHNNVIRRLQNYSEQIGLSLRRNGKLSEFKLRQMLGNGFDQEKQEKRLNRILKYHKSSIIL